ncbi:hypothetical protein ACFL54_00715 [Planctomycetota bacterium]
MFSVIGKVTKWGTITLVTVLLAAFIFGKHRVTNVFSSMQSNVNQTIDDMLDTRVVLENKLKAVQKEYPSKIASVKIQLREIDKLLEDITKDIAVYEDVVTLCNDDLSALEVKMSELADNGDTGQYIQFKAQNLDGNSALSKAEHILETRREYESKMEQAKTDAATLQAQQRDMQVYLQDIEKEYHTFLNEVAKLQQEIEIIDRNEKIIGMFEDQKDYRGYTLSNEVSALRSLKNRIEEAKIFQEENLKRIKTVPSSNDYEVLVRMKQSR